MKQLNKIKKKCKKKFTMKHLNYCLTNAKYFNIDFIGK